MTTLIAKPPRRLWTHGLLAVVLVSGSLQAAEAPAADPTATADEGFYETIDVDLVNLEVVVRDAAGPVSGLTADDFTIREDGADVAITNFEEAAPLAGEATAAPATDGEVAATSEEASLLLTVFVDRSTLLPGAARHLAPAVDELLAKALRGSDRVLVVAWDDRLETVLRPTADRAAAQAAVSAALVGGAKAMRSKLDRENLLRTLAGSSLFGDRPDGEAPGPFLQGPTEADMAASIANEIELYGQERDQELRRGAAALSETLGQLAGYPGRRALLYLGGGFEDRAAEPLIRAWRERYAQLGSAAAMPRMVSNAVDPASTRALDEIARRAVAAGVTFYSISDRDALIVDASDSGAGTTGPAREAALQSQQNRQLALSDLARKTGGIALGTASVSEAIAKLGGDLSAFYELGYASPVAADGKPRQIAVSVRPEALAGRKVEVRYRPARLAKSPDERMRERTLAALVLDTTANPLELTVEAGIAPPDGAAPASTGSEALVNLTIHLPLGKVALMPRGAFHEGRLSLFLSARDAKSRVAPVQRIELPLRIPNDRLLVALGQAAVYETTMRIRAERHEIAVGVRDEIGGVESTVRVSVEPGG
jgi:VWFA-related protein